MGQSLIQLHFRVPAQSAFQETHVGVIIADVDAFSFRWKGHGLESSASVNLHQELGKLLQRYRRLGTAEIEYRSLAVGIPGHEEHRINAVVDIGEISKLPAFPYFKRFATECLFDPHSQKRLSGILNSHVWAISVCQTQDAGLHAVNIIVKLGALISKCAVISDIEINPLMVYEQGEGSKAVDVRILLAKQAGK